MSFQAQNGEGERPRKSREELGHRKEGGGRKATSPRTTPPNWKDKAEERHRRSPPKSQLERPKLQTGTPKGLPAGSRGGSRQMTSEGPLRGKYLPALQRAPRDASGSLPATGRSLLVAKRIPGTLGAPSG